MIIVFLNELVYLFSEILNNEIFNWKMLRFSSIYLCNFPIYWRVTGSTLPLFWLVRFITVWLFRCENRRNSFLNIQIGIFEINNVEFGLELFNSFEISRRICGSCPLVNNSGCVHLRRNEQSSCDRRFKTQKLELKLLW